MKTTIPLLKNATLLVSSMLFCTDLQAAPINSISYGSITGTGLVDFEDLPHITAPGTNYNGIFASGGTRFAERFVGQTLSSNGNSDVLSGAPNNPLALQVGAADQNINVFDYTPANGNVLTGLGPLGFPNFDAIGEGAFSMLFDFDQAAFGFQLIGGNLGSGTLDFYKRDGSLISTFSLTGLADAYYGFEREGGTQDIAGISIYNLDLGGVGFDNLKFTVQGVSGVPDGGTTLALLGLSLAGMAAARRSSTK